MPKYFHKNFGYGNLLLDEGNNLVINFSHGIERCPKNDVEEYYSVEDKCNLNKYDELDFCILHTQAALIQAINDSWGVFSKSNVDLLPHQLWVCNKVITKWPFRYLIADDVGLGKTVEAGLILWPLKSSGKLKRLLILTPAPLVDQWQYRLRTMFDIRLAKYTPEQDSSKSDFWNTHNLVVASLPTLTQVHKKLREERQERLLSSEKWDLIIVDEAHHMNYDERQGKTLGFQLFEKLEEANKVDSCLFFTGTPHRGKDYGFWALMRLVNPDVFSEKKDSEEQYKYLCDNFIRNNKQNVTDMKGEKLFKELRQHPGTFDYTPAEALFYEKMSNFILEGKAYALTQDKVICQQIMLVLISLQKIASSSIYAVKAAFETRLKNFNVQLQNSSKQYQDFENLYISDDADDEEKELIKNALKEYFTSSLVLMQNEVDNLKELIKLADAVKEESRIKKIIESIENDYPNDQVLLFTEYKRTQALMISALANKWGEDKVGFINGDNFLPNVVLDSGKVLNLSEKRESTAEKFNEGKIKYLVSTEAAGEGIDLQKNCHVLIHVDLPWNPMRLHQRVGRLHRYGQTQPVDVLSFRNMATVEARIWDKLQTKLIQIEKMFVAGMEDPEDIMWQVLGMQNPGFYDELYSEGLMHQKTNTLDQWFDAKTQTLGGVKIVNSVKSILGNAAKFNLAGLDSVPKLDLPDLIPFFKSAVTKNGRRITINDDHFSFITPKTWDNEFGVQPEYNDLIFRRNTKPDESPGNICGVGHIIFNKALEFANVRKESVSLIKGDSSYYIFRVFDKITYGRGTVLNRFIIIKQTENNMEPLSEECFFKILETLKPADIGSKPTITTNINNLEKIVKSSLAGSNNFDFQDPGYELFSVFLNA